MPYPHASDRDVEFFGEHGWIVVEDAIDPADLDVLMGHCVEILAKKETMAYDWAWEKSTPRVNPIKAGAVSLDGHSFNVREIEPEKSGL